MKLAFCLFKYFPFGGMQRDFIRIAAECSRRGHEIHVFTLKWEGPVPAFIQLHLLPTKGFQNHTRIKHFIKYLKPHLPHYDKIIGFNKMPFLDIYYAADTCYQAKVAEQRSYWYQLSGRYKSYLNNEKAVFAKELSTEILLLSENQKKEFTHYYGTPLNRLHILPPGISPDRKAPANAPTLRQQIRTQYGLQTHDPLLLLVGSGFKTKGLDRAIRGLANLPLNIKNQTHLFVVGQDNAKPFKHLAHRLAVSQQVTFLGGRNDIPLLLLAADLLIHPAYNENTGTVILEALVAGLPVLTTDVCGYAPYVQKAQAGYVLPSPFNQTEFNTILAQMLVDPNKSFWQKNALAFSESADIYSLPEQAADIILQATAP